MSAEVIDDPDSGLHLEDDPALNHYNPDDEGGLGPRDVTQEASKLEGAASAAKALDAGAPARPDAGAAKGAANALLFHSWDGDKEKDS